MTNPPVLMQIMRSLFMCHGVSIRQNKTSLHLILRKRAKRSHGTKMLKKIWSWCTTPSRRSALDIFCTKATFKIFKFFGIQFIRRSLAVSDLPGHLHRRRRDAVLQQFILWRVHKEGPIVSFVQLKNYRSLEAQHSYPQTGLRTFCNVL